MTKKPPTDRPPENKPATDRSTTPDADKRSAPDALSRGDVSNVPHDADEPLAPPGYELLAKVGSGGMGVVYRARDIAFNRDVAVKLLLPQFSAGHPVAQRFLEEAQITGQLQHPGIPPVHQVGIFPDGRPYLVMKLIKGDALDLLLSKRTSFAQDGARYVAVFEQICLAVGYAHNRKVVHRDLKPANVMVGAFGEVQVMDWGIAKIVGATTEPRPDVPIPGTEIRSVRELGTETQVGSVLGSLAYMPPEQAGGEVAKIDPRTDVFGLGAVLCCILTGVAPYTGSSKDEIHLKAIRGHTADAFVRLDACGAEPELIALCKRCLDADPTARPADGGEVAAVLASFRADAERRARQAELDRVRAEGELELVRVTADGEREAARMRIAEQRMKRKVQLALLASVALLVFAGGTFAWWRDKETTERANEENQRKLIAQTEEDRRAATTEHEVTTALAEMKTQCDRGDREIDNPPRWREALNAAFNAHRGAEKAIKVGPASDELRANFDAATKRLNRDQYDCETAELCEKWFLDVLRARVNKSDSSDFAEVLQKAEDVFTRVGVPPTTTPPDAVAAKIRGHRLRYQLTILLTLAVDLEQADASADENPQEGRNVFAKHAQSLASELHPKQSDVRTVLSEENGLDGFLAGPGQSLSGSELVTLCITCDLTGERRDAVSRLLDEAIRRNPTNPVALVIRLHGRDHNYSKIDQARRIAAGAAVTSNRPDEPALWSTFGDRLMEDGFHNWAADCFRRVVQLDSTNDHDHIRLAEALIAAGRVGEGLDVYRDAIQRRSSVSTKATILQVRGAKTAILLAQSTTTESEESTSKQREKLRREALSLLTAWLRDWMRDRPTAPPVWEDVRWVQTPSNFVQVRDRESLNKIPPEEAKQWIELWQKIDDIPIPQKLRKEKKEPQRSILSETVLPVPKLVKEKKEPQRSILPETVRPVLPEVKRP